jgi:ribA/ribD-fused uncharacterized protein
MNQITSFSGQYDFLSNFYPCKVLYDDILYPSAEHAYVAAKTLDQTTRKMIAQDIATAGQAKKFGRNLDLRTDWDKIKVNEMRKILESKFSDEHLMTLLWATKPAELIEGNVWNDRFWGQCPVGIGQNHLGKLLMSIRDDITNLFILQ